MLNIQFKRNSEPVDDTELLSVVDAVGRYMHSDVEADRELGLLLSKMVLRIHLETSKNRATPAGGKPSGTSLVNYVGVTTDLIVAHVATVAAILDETCIGFDLMGVGQALRDELPAIAGRVSDETFQMLVGVCASIIGEASKRMTRDVIREGKSA